jgi:hypothetical protein
MGKALVVGLAAVLVVASGVSADMVTPTFSFSGGQQSITASLSASGSATLSGSGTYYSWVGWPVSSWASVSINMNNQTVNLGTNPSVIGVNKDPMGNGQVAFGNGIAPNKALSSASLMDLNVTDFFGGSPQGLALNPVSLDGEISGIGIPVTMTLNTSGSLSNFSFDMTSNPAFTYKKSGALPSITYGWVGSGDASVNYNLAITGNLDVAGIFSVDLGQLINYTGNFATAAPLLGDMVLTELGGPYPRDVEVHISSNFQDWTPVTVPFTTSGVVDFNNYGGGEGGSYYKVHVDYAFNGSLNVDGVTLDLYSTIADIVPEPITLAVMGVGAGLLTLARRRSK